MEFTYAAMLFLCFALKFTFKYIALSHRGIFIYNLLHID